MPTITLWMQKDGMDHAVVARRSQPLRTVFQACCSRLGLQAPHVRIICAELLSPDDTPDQLGLEDDHILDVVVWRRRSGGG